MMESLPHDRPCARSHSGPLRLLLVGFALSITPAIGLRAEPPADTAQRVELHRADLSGAPGMEVVASITEYRPGEHLERHFHHGIEAAYVVQGATVQAPGKAPMELATGASVMHLREIRHGGFQIVGDTPLKLFTVHVVDKGQPLYDHAP